MRHRRRRRVKRVSPQAALGLLVGGVAFIGIAALTNMIGIGANPLVFVVTICLAVIAGCAATLYAN